ncbi:MAG: MFS transporter, partial [Verrucomicrobiota bacterium]
VAKIEIGKETSLGLTSSQMAWIDGAFLTYYALGQFVWGVCGDRFGARKVILGGLLGSIIAAAAMGATSSAFLMGFFFCLQGLCQSTGWAPLTKNIGCFFSQKERGTILGLWCTNYAVGGLFASVYAAYFGALWGWRFAFFIPAATLFGIWLIFYFFQRDCPEDVGLPPIEQYKGEMPAPSPTESEFGEVASKREEEKHGSWSAVLEVLRNPMVLLLAAVYFFMKPIRYALLFWGPKYVSEKLGTGMIQSGALSALFELAGPLSVFLAGWISDKWFGAKRNPVSVICLFALAVLLFAMDKLPASKWMLGSMLFLIGLVMFAPDSLVSGTAAVDFGTKRGASTAAGLINGSGSVGAILGGTIPGFFHEKWGWGGVFTALAISVFLAGLLLLPKWHALPESSNTTK